MYIYIYIQIYTYTFIYIYICISQRENAFMTLRTEMLIVPYWMAIS